MVYLEEIIRKRREELLRGLSIQHFCYYYISDRRKLQELRIDLIGEEDCIAAQGYKGVQVAQEDIQHILAKKPIKKLDYTTNIFKLLGIHLASSGLISDKIENKFDYSSLKFKYLISKVFPEFEDKFKHALDNESESTEFPYFDIFRYLHQKPIKFGIEHLISELLKNDPEIIDLVVLEDLQKDFLSKSVSKLQSHNNVIVQVSEISLDKESKINQIHTRNKVFVSYSRLDSKWLQKLQKHLKFLERKGIINWWDDTRIKSGQKWRDEIKQALDSAKIAILLVSSNFLASDFIEEHELQPLLLAAKNEGVIILSVILDPCKSIFSLSELEAFQAVNPPSRPLSGMNEHEQGEVLDKMTGEIIEALGLSLSQT